MAHGKRGQPAPSRGASGGLVRPIPPMCGPDSGTRLTRLLAGRLIAFRVSHEENARDEKSKANETQDVA